MAAWSGRLGLQAIPGLAAEHVALLHFLHFGLIILPAAAFHTAVVWSEARARRVQQAARLGYIIGLLFCVLEIAGLVSVGFVNYSWGAIVRPGPLHPALVVFLITWVGLGIFLCRRTLRDSANPLVRLRAKYWLMGVMVSFPLGLVNFLANYGVPVFPTGSLGNIFLVGVVAYAAVRHRLMDIDVLVMRAAATFLASVAVMLPVTAALVWVRQSSIGVAGFLVAGGLLLVGAVSLLAFARVRSYVEQQVESSFFPARWAARDALRRLSADLVKLPHDEGMSGRFATTLMDGLRLSGVAVYLRATRPGFLTLACSHGSINAPPRINGATFIAESANDQTVVILQRADGSVHPDAARRFEWEAYVPLRTDGTCVGLIALGAKRSGAVIDDSDVVLLGVVSAHLAIAVRNAEYVRQIERQKAAIEALQKRLAAENVALREEVRSHSQFKEIIGSSTALQRVLAVVEKVAPTSTSILVTGETGTGKELIARAIHELSPRRNGPLISVNCPAIPPTLAESELFGHERGAFTDAREARAGKFELADGGTIFLDEVADLPLDVQVKLLRVLQEKETQRLGSRAGRKLDLRVVAATNRDLQAEMQAQRFRPDLYHRLAAVVVTVPPLRQRIDDIPMLPSCFLDRAALMYQRPIRGFSAEAMEALRRYNWPGNIRELQNVVERAVLLCTSEIIKPEHLSDLAISAVPAQPFGTAIRAEKLRRVEQAMAQAGGNRSAAARLLGISRSNFDRLMKSLGVKPAPSVQ